MKTILKSIVLSTKKFFYQAQIIIGNRIILQTYIRIYINKIFKVARGNSERKLILENMVHMSNVIPSPFFWLDLEGKILGLNSRAVQFMGAKHEREVVGKMIRDLYPRNVAEQLCLDFLSVVKSKHDIKRKYSLEDQAIHKVKIFLVRTFPLFDSQNHIFGTVSTLTDADEEKRNIENSESFPQ